MAVSYNLYLDKPYLPGKEVQEQVKEFKKSGADVPANLLNPDETAVYLYVTIDRKTIKMRTNERVQSVHWNFNKSEVRRTHLDHIEINKRLGNLLAGAKKYYKKYLKKSEGNPTLAGARDYIKKKLFGGEVVDRAAPTFFDIYDRFIEYQTKNVKGQTLAKYNTLKKLLNEATGGQALDKKGSRVGSGYDGQEAPTIAKDRLDISRIDDSFVIDFKVYLHKGRGQVNDTMAKYLECLKYFLKWAYDNGYSKNDSFTKIEAKRIKNKNDKVYLTLEEFYSIYNVELQVGSVQAQVRDMFCFQMLTGQRFSDVLNVSWSDIVNGADGLEWRLYQAKGNKERMLNIPLFKDVLPILNRYRGRGEVGKIFPYVSNPTANEYIKVVAEAAGLNEGYTRVRYSLKEQVKKSGSKFSFITTHTARTTFVTLSLERGMRAEVVMNITGHENIRTMQIYQQLIEKVKQKEAKAIWDSVSS